MALADLQSFITQCLNTVDSTIDTTPGSPYDVNVVQPILQRLGPDPFTVDIGLFLQTLINQQFPDLPTKEGDAITDLLIKPAIVLWNPIVREISRVENCLSFANASTLTTAEADALGANLFATRPQGSFASGTARVYFAQPQNSSVSPANFFTSKEGLVFFPTETQSIAVSEMLLNYDGALYYFDVSVIAQAAGAAYSIAANDLITVANLAAATRVTNLKAFAPGTDAETAVEFIDNIGQSLTERSLVTNAGIIAKVTSNFSAVTQLNTVGFNDPNMQRDVITGGGLGGILAGGVSMFTEADGANMVLTSQVSTAESVDFTVLIGPTGVPVTGFTITLAGAFPPATLPLVQDLEVLQVVDPQTLLLATRPLAYSATGCVWTLRKNVLTLSNIPGGILFPNTPEGTVTVPNNQIHIGGATDVFVRGTALDSNTLVISNIVDDDPLLEGTTLHYNGTLTDPTALLDIGDFVLGTNYSVGDSTWTVFNDAVANTLTIEILDPPNAGTYRILEVAQVPGQSPILAITPTVLCVTGSYRWRISSSIFVDLVEPKETKIAGSDLNTVQGLSVITTSGGADFDDYGVAPKDILRITSGNLIQGDYVVQSVLSPLYTQIQVDRPLPATINGATYSIFTPNPTGGISLPFVRVDSIDLLDTSGQPVGTIIPYANPIDVESQGFANSANGVKADLDDGILGIVTMPRPAGASVVGMTLVFTWEGLGFNITCTFTGSNPLSMTSIAAQINAATYAATTGRISRIAVLLQGTSRVGMVPVAPNVTLLTTSTALVTLFGFNDRAITSRDIRSGDINAPSPESQIDATGGWAALRPALDPVFDVAQVLDGLQIGFYSGLVVPNAPFNDTLYDPLQTTHDFSPEVDRHIQVGSRSLGTARMYFLDPTSIEVNPATAFVYTNPTGGSELTYFPDPTNSYQRIPSLPSGTQPKDGETSSGIGVSTFQSVSTDFIQEGIQPGDLLRVTYVPLTGSAVLADPVVGLNALILTVSISGGIDKNIIFIRDSSSIPTNAVSQAGVVTQINNIVGQTIASLNVSNQLEFNPTVSVIVRGSSASNSANTLLGFSLINGIDQNNNSPNKGTYVIKAVNQDSVVVTTAFPTGATDTAQQQFQVLRTGIQRIVSTTMATQTADAGLYYFDVELLSQGTGDQYNIAAALQMTVTGYKSDGYYLTTDDPALTFSPIERPKLHISPTILEVGVSDNPANATQLTGQNIQLNYDSSALAGDVDTYIRSDTERVINESPLGRHLIPYFVRFSMTYSGGSASSLVQSDAETYINGLTATASLSVSNLIKIANNRGALNVDTPIDLVAVIHNFDRSITVERSEDAINTGTLAAFIPDVLSIVQNMT